jgi:mannose-6-phosphate isomerase-like protein (cupin superfamily)
MDYDIRLDDKYGSLTLIDIPAEVAANEPWFNQTLTTVNDSVVRLGIIEGDFHWHSHAEEDEFFLVRKGVFIIRYRDGADVVLNEGDFHVVRRGVEHMTAAHEECWVIFVEPAGTRHSGDIVSEQTKSIESQLGELHPWGA